MSIRPQELLSLAHNQIMGRVDITSDSYAICRGENRLNRQNLFDLAQTMTNS
jgi:hypothetical protein